MRRMVLLLLAMSLPLCVQTAYTQTTYTASSGAVSSFNAVTAYLDLGGAFVSPNSMGAGCYFGGCPAWTFTDYPFSYVLPDGTTASFSNFSGTADFSVQSDVKVDGTASGVDSNNNPVVVSVHFEWAAFCRSGRGGGCRKIFLTGTLTIS